MAKAKHAKRPKPAPAFPDGMTIVEERVRGERNATRAVLCRPGDFVWKYRTHRDGRSLYSEVQYHAGMRFAALWEAAGLAEPRGVDWGAPPSGKGWRGLPPAAVEAMDDLRGVQAHLGQAPTCRLIDHVVRGHTVNELAERWGWPARKMATVLESDLDAVVDYFGYSRD